jgi:NADPH:quinone reductase
MNASVLTKGAHRRMRAVVCQAYGPPEALTVMETDAPSMLGPDEVRIAVHAAGVNFPDTLIIQGLYQLKPPLPFIPGFEVAGVITELGSAVADRTVGQRVMALTSSGYGAFAEQAVAKSSGTVPIPEGIDAVDAAGFYTAYGTAYHALVQRAALQRGETLVVLGASGGVGLAAVDIGVALGAKVIAVGRTEQRLTAAHAKGAHELVGYDDGQLGQRIKALTGGKGADVCIDMLGGDAFDQMSRAMNWQGRLLVVGFTSGVIPRFPVNLALLKGYQLVGVYWGEFAARSPLVNADNFQALARLIAEGQIHPEVSAVYPLDRVADALNDLSGRRTIGKLVLTLTSAVNGG